MEQVENFVVIVGLKLVFAIPNVLNVGEQESKNAIDVMVQVIP